MNADRRGWNNFASCHPVHCGQAFISYGRSEQLLQLTHGVGPNGSDDVDAHLVIAEIEQTGQLAVDFTCAFGHAVHRDRHLRLVHSSAILLPTASQQQRERSKLNHGRRRKSTDRIPGAPAHPVSGGQQGSVRLAGADRSEPEFGQCLNAPVCLSGHAARLTHGGSKPRPLSIASAVCIAKATMTRRWHATILIIIAYTYRQLLARGRAIAIFRYIECAAFNLVQE